nr:hypothetical protein [Tanacetum cinerariifolium]
GGKPAINVIRSDLHLDDVDGVECLPNEKIFAELARMGYEKPPPKLKFYKAFFSAQWKFLIHTLVQCLSRKFNFSKYIFDSMVRNVDSPTKFLMYPRFLQVVINNQVDDLTSHNTKYTSPALTQKVFNNMRIIDSIPTLHATPPQDQPSTPLASPPQKQPTTTSESSMSLLTTLMETCATLSKKKLEKKKRSKSSEFKRLRKVGTTQRVESSNDIDVGAQEDASKQEGKIEAIDSDEDITLVDVETQEEAVTIDAEPQGRIDQEDVNAASKRVNAAELLYLMMKRKYQSLKKKPVSIAQARKNMIIYLKNMAGYKMEHFRGMTYDKVRPIFEREYKKVQTLFKPDKDVEEPKKKRFANETLL